jgi:hypothetical protein
MSNMTDADFVKELARRLNTFLEQAPERANGVLATPMPHAGYAGVAHFLGELGMPKGVTDQTNMGDLQETLFLFPIIEDHRIVHFEVVTGVDLAQKALDAQKPPVH